MTCARGRFHSYFLCLPGSKRSVIELNRLHLMLFFLLDSVELPLGGSSFSWASASGLETLDSPFHKYCLGPFPFKQKQDPKRKPYVNVCISMHHRRGQLIAAHY
ncbi:unnamed protein product (mitochondrion) [Musa textilis]